MHPPDEASDHAGDVAQILNERARRMALPTRRRPSGGAAHLVVRVGRQRVAVPMSALRQVVAPPRMTRLPGPSPLSLVALAGSLVPVVDLAVLLENGESPAGPEPLLLIIEDGHSRLGLRVDDVEGQTTVGAQDIAGAAAPANRSTSLATPISGEDLLVLDVNATLADPRLSLAPAASGAGADTRR